VITIADAVAALKEKGTPISGSRLTLLADQGRIPGAEKVHSGTRKMWMLPLDFKITPVAKGAKLSAAAAAIDLLVYFEDGSQARHACNNLIEVDKVLKDAVNRGGFAKAKMFQQGRHEERLFERVLNPQTGKLELQKDKKTARFLATSVEVSKETTVSRHKTRIKEAVDAVVFRLRALAKSSVEIGDKNVGAVLESVKLGKIDSDTWLVYKGDLYKGSPPPMIRREIARENTAIENINKGKKRGEAKLAPIPTESLILQELLSVNHEFRVEFNQSMRPFLMRIPKDGTFTMPQPPIDRHLNNDEDSVRMG
jgi:hypothetical protein